MRCWTMVFAALPEEVHNAMLPPKILPAEELDVCDRKYILLFDGVLAERSATKTVAMGAMMLSEKSQGKALQATVVTVGSSRKEMVERANQSVSVKPGDKVLLPEYGDTKVILDDKGYFLFRDGDILGKYVD
ncbi:10 kDa heat shock protein, mitochondrial-like [Mesocricetus auratus]|uniref:10 kDa heat shock protein, mitochondrial-like n=1 Tax=Mesocricetus auratus TaxID=10036 RepID=A0ABM2YEY7_MESAU|nr:10 kDa heat shock protein, mitochondrial-like [Mesocricetus auratus]